MKARWNPIYHDGRAAYGIDRCEPQRRAIEAGKIEFHALTHGHYPGRSIDRTVLPGLNSAGFWNARAPQDWGLESHRNEGIEIVFLETGSMVFTVDGRRHDLRAGHFTVTRPWQLHKLGDPNIGPGRLHWLIIDVGVRRPNQDWRWPPWVVLTPADLEELTRKLRRNEHPVWTVTPDIVHAFREIAACVTDLHAPGRQSRMIIHLNHLLLGVLEALRAQQRQEDASLTSRRRTAELFLEDLSRSPGALGEPWTLESMARHCGMGTTTFSLLCREVANTSPMEYLNRCRLDWAMAELKNCPDRTITDIALAAGFGSSQYFSTCFRRRFRRTPREIRAGRV